MSKQLHYGIRAKVFHWLIVALLFFQFPLGWLMPDIHRGPPGTPMTFHISLGVIGRDLGDSVEVSAGLSRSDRIINSPPEL